MFCRVLELCRLLMKVTNTSSRFEVPPLLISTLLTLPTSIPIIIIHNEYQKIVQITIIRRVFENHRFRYGTLDENKRI